MLEVRIIGEHVLDRHARGQELEEVLDGVSQTTNRRLAVTDRRVRHDAIQPGHGTTVPLGHANPVCSLPTHDQTIVEHGPRRRQR